MFLDASAPQNFRTRTARLLAVLFGALALGAACASAQVPGELVGRVTDAQSARPIGGARIELVGRVGYALSRVDGSFFLRGLEPGEFAVRVRALGHAPRDTVVTIANGRMVSERYAGTVTSNSVMSLLSGAAAPQAGTGAPAR